MGWGRGLKGGEGVWRGVVTDVVFGRGSECTLFATVGEAARHMVQQTLLPGALSMPFDKHECNSNKLA